MRSTIVIAAILAVSAGHADSSLTLSDSKPATAYAAQVLNPDLAGALRVPGSRTLIAWGTDGTILRSEDSRPWKHAKTPSHEDLARAAADAKGHTLIAVGSGAAILRSQDAGQQWARAVMEPVDCDLKTVTFDPKRSAWIAAGTRGCILRSLDNGQTWQRVATQLQLTFHALMFDERTGKLLIGADDGVTGTSSDGGATWNLVWIDMPDPLTPVAGFHRFGSVLLARSALGRFLLSHDDAESWDVMQSDSRAFFTDAASDPERNVIVMIGHDGTILRSADGGKSWSSQLLAPQGRASYLSAILHDARRKALVVVGHGGVVSSSSDGTRWDHHSAGIRMRIDGLAHDADGGLVAVGSGGALARSGDGGRRWTLARDGFDGYLREAAAAPGSDAFVATGQLGQLLYFAQGAQWHRIEFSYPQEATPPDLRVLIPVGDRLLAAGPPGALLRSDQRGDRWTLQHWTRLEDGQAFPAVIADRRRNTLVAIEARGGMQMSRDGGANWQRTDVAVGSGELWQGAALESTGAMIAVGKAGTLARSVDSGSRWALAKSGTDHDLFGAFSDEDNKALFAVGAAGTLLRSTDGGASWTAMVSGTQSPLRRMMRDPRSGALVCFGGDGVILRSTDAGLTWRAVHSGTTLELRKAIVESVSGDLMIAGRGGTVVRSRDGGSTWERLATHTTRHFTSIAANRNGDLIAVGERIVRFSPENSQ